MSGPVKDADLRDAKDFLIGAVADQAKALGALPNVRAHEDLVTPIIRTIDVDARDEQPAPAPEPPQMVADAMAQARPVSTNPDRKQQAYLKFIGFLKQFPEWEERMFKAGTKALPLGHTDKDCPRCGGGPCNVREALCEFVINQAKLIFGDPEYTQPTGVIYSGA